MKKTKFVAAVAAALLITGCASTKTADEPKAKTVEAPKETKQEVVSNNPLKYSDEDYAKILKSSLYSAGNNYRMKKVIEKLRAGKSVYIAALGGSVTEGAGPSNFRDGYAYQFNKKLRAEFTPDNGANVYFDGAGLSGTPSPLGLVRYDTDVIDTLGGAPDILIIEFAVNDGGECTKTRAFEKLIRDALEANPEACVIALYADATYPNTQDAMSPVATFYRIPQVSVKNGMRNSGVVFDQKAFFSDYVHPTKAGHEIMADCLINLFRTVDAAAENTPFEIPADYYNRNPFTTFKRITGDDENVKISAGGFNGVDPNCQSIKKTGKSDFPQNWYHSSTADSESFVMNINCKSLVFVHKNQGSWLPEKFGRAEVYVDGQFKVVYDGGADGGWGNCIVNMIIDEPEAKEHVVEVKMKAGEENKGFTIVAMGYSK